jgi:hypothetical protein
MNIFRIDIAGKIFYSLDFTVQGNSIYPLAILTKATPDIIIINLALKPASSL